MLSFGGRFKFVSCRFPLGRTGYLQANQPIVVSVVKMFVVCESIISLLWDCPAYAIIRSAFMSLEIGFQSLDSFAKSSYVLYCICSEAWEECLTLGTHARGLR